jgi:thiamine pyrophosphokinase
VIVDGGINRYIKFMTENGLDQSLKKPDVVCGDFDSCTDESIAVAKKLGAEVLQKDCFLNFSFCKIFVTI